LKNFALGEGIDHSVRDDIHHEIDRCAALGCGGVAGDRLGVDACGIGIERVFGRDTWRIASLRLL
jgi:hypothetical protein